MILLLSVTPTHFRDSDDYKCTSTDTDRTESLRQGRKYLVLVPTTPSSCPNSHYQPITSPSSVQSLLRVQILSIFDSYYDSYPALSKLWQKDRHNFKASMNYIARLWCSSSPQGKGVRKKAVKEKRKRKEKRPAF